ncbi:hypothetical protein C8F01DRAFT_1372865 [Mycena amicta]|nr:hypothetical protein C8F01DRAFT_1372865 [Mycena amicta]
MAPGALDSSRVPPTILDLAFRSPCPYETHSDCRYSEIDIVRTKNARREAIWADTSAYGPVRSDPRYGCFLSPRGTNSKISDRWGAYDRVDSTYESDGAEYQRACHLGAHSNTSPPVLFPLARFIPRRGQQAALPSPFWCYSCSIRSQMPQGLVYLAEYVDILFHSTASTDSRNLFCASHVTVIISFCPAFGPLRLLCPPILFRLSSYSVGLAIMFTCDHALTARLQRHSYAPDDSPHEHRAEPADDDDG